MVLCAVAVAMWQSYVFITEHQCRNVRELELDDATLPDEMQPEALLCFTQSSVTQGKTTSCALDQSFTNHLVTTIMGLEVNSDS